MTVFTRTWDASYEANPPDTQAAKQGAARIREVKVDVGERLAVDHSWDGDTEDGEHLQVTLRERVSDPAAVSGKAFLYSKDVDTDDIEIFARDSNANVIRVTFEGGLNAAAVNGDLSQANTNLEDGAFTTVQSSNTDATAGALLINGAWGLGGEATQYADFDSAVNTEFFQDAGGGTLNRPNSNVWTGISIADTSANSVQLGLRTAQPQVAIRNRIGGSFGAWSFLGTTSLAQTWTDDQTFESGLYVGSSSGMRFYYTGSTANAQIITGSLNFRDGSAATKYLFNTASGDFHADGDVIAYSTTTGSDIRYKDNIRAITGEEAQGVADGLKGKFYFNKKLNRWDSGFIAQQSEPITPHLVSEQGDLSGKVKRKFFNYIGTIPYIVEARKQDNIDHKRRADELQKRVDDLETRLDRLEKT